MTAPLIGRTYSLQDPCANSDAYYRQIGVIADRFQAGTDDTQNLLDAVLSAGRNRNSTKNLSSPLPSRSGLLEILSSYLSRYTQGVSNHLEELTVFQRFDRTLSMKESQYHLAMLEIELVSRKYLHQFRRCSTRLAFLPHCLRDLEADCHSVKRGADYVCKGCSKNCSINALSKLLRRHGVTPYIWMSANLGSLLRSLRKEGKTVGVVGIACIPELLDGMRRCQRAGVPVIGVPLDANRCARWWGEFRPNSVNLVHLENLLGPATLRKPARLLRDPKAPW